MRPLKIEVNYDAPGFLLGQQHCSEEAASHPDVSLDENMRAKEGGKETTGFAYRLYPSHGPLLFITSHSRFALASTMRKTVKRLRRRLSEEVKPRK